MGDVLLVGLSHFPMLSLPDENWKGLFLKMLSDPGIPPHMRDPSGWPEGLRREWGNDQALQAAKTHRAELLPRFRAIREELERFNPDFILVWGDDQYENFQDDAIPPYSILAYDRLTVTPWKLPNGGVKPNVWKEGADFSLEVDFHRKGAKYLATHLLKNHFDVTYAYKPLHATLGHAFLNPVLFLDYERKGFPWKIVPFHVNCYGSRIVSQRGNALGLSETEDPEKLDPPSPMPARCFDLGRACARAAQESPWRIALMASSSWSHAFLTRKHYYLYPDLDADRKLFDDMTRGQYMSMRERTLDQIDESGQQELLNWVCLAGAMHELKAKPHYAEFQESYVFNSPKIFLSAHPAV